MLDACSSYCSKISPFKPPFMPILRYMTFGTLIHLGNQRLLERQDGIKSKIKGTEGPEGLKVQTASSQEKKTSVWQTSVTKDENQNTWCMSSITALSRFTGFLLIAVWLLYFLFPWSPAFWRSLWKETSYQFLSWLHCLLVLLPCPPECSQFSLLHPEI